MPIDNRPLDFMAILVILTVESCGQQPVGEDAGSLLAQDRLEWTSDRTADFCPPHGRVLPSQPYPEKTR